MLDLNGRALDTCPYISYMRDCMVLEVDISGFENIFRFGKDGEASKLRRK